MIYRVSYGHQLAVFPKPDGTPAEVTDITTQIQDAVTMLERYHTEGSVAAAVADNLKQLLK